MAYQLVYTSSPRGLKPGAFGFCVVACTRGMKEQTTSALEALSGYRRIYADPRDASRNPTSYSHVLFETATGRLRILARVADAGLDYSGRTNKIASFLDVSENELAPPGPAALFSQPGLFVANWSSSSAPQYYEAPIALPNYVPIPLGCNEWRKTTGDPAWAGVLASTVATRRPVVLIARPEQNVLQLFQESLALLPPGERWKATFSTYYMKTPPGVQCQWKAVMQGSPEELALRSTPGALILDLTNPINLPSLASLVVSQEEKALVAAASGRFQTNVGPTNAFKSVPSASPAVAAPPTAPGVAPLPGAVPIGAPTPYDLAPSDSPVPKRKTLNYGRDAILTVELPQERKGREIAFLTKIFACVGCASVLGVIVIVIVCASMGLRCDSIKKILLRPSEIKKAAEDTKGETPESTTEKALSPKPADSVIQDLDESKNDESKENQTNEPKPETPTESVNLDETSELTSSSTASEESSVRGTAIKDAQKSENKENKNKTEKTATIFDEDGGISDNDDIDDNDASEVPRYLEEDEIETGDTNKSARDDAPVNKVENKRDDNKNDRKTNDQPFNDAEEETDDNEDVNFDLVANDIENALEMFKKNGEKKYFDKAQSLVEQNETNVPMDNSSFNDAKERYFTIKKAMELDSFRFLIQDKEGFKQEQENEMLLTTDNGEFYEDLKNFFQVFESGIIRLTFKRGNGNDKDVFTQKVDISADSFMNKQNNRLDSNIERNPFYIDFNGHFAALRFVSTDSALRWRRYGSIEVEAFANLKSVFHAPAEPLLSCSDFEVELDDRYKPFDLGWLFGEKPMIFSSETEKDTLFIEFVHDEGSDFSIATPKDIGDVKIDPNKNKNQYIVALIWREHNAVKINPPLDFLYVVTFSLKDNKIKRERLVKYKVGERGKWERENGPLGVLGESALTFNVRYRTYDGQEDNIAPIVGVIKVPIPNGKK